MNQALGGFPGGGPSRARPKLQFRREGTYVQTGALGYTTAATGAYSAWVEVAASTGDYPVLVIPFNNNLPEQNLVLGVGPSGAERQLDGMSYQGSVTPGYPGIMWAPARTRLAFRAFNPNSSGRAGASAGSVQFRLIQLSEMPVVGRSMWGNDTVVATIAAGVAPAWGAWGEVVKAGIVPYRFRLASMQDFFGVGGEWQIGVGGAGAESPVAQYSEITANGLLGSGTSIFPNNGYASGPTIHLAQFGIITSEPMSYVFPAGARVAMRWRTTVGGHNITPTVSAHVVEAL